MVDSLSSSTLGAAVGIQQGRVQEDTAIKSLKSEADSQQSAAAALLGGNVTATRGQNLNILV